MRCPFGVEVGEPPSPWRCDRRWRDCHCVRELVSYAMAEMDDQTATVVAFWQDHPEPLGVNRKVII